MECPNHGAVAARQHAQDAAFGTAVVALTSDLNQHLVAMHGRADCRRRDEDVTSVPPFRQLRARGRGTHALSRVRDDEAIAIAMHGEAARDEVLTGRGVVGKRVAVAPGFDEARALHQRLQAFGELLAFRAAQAHLAHELLVTGRVVRLAFDVAQNGLIGEHSRRRSSAASEQLIVAWAPHCQLATGDRLLLSSPFAVIRSRFVN